MRRRPNPHKSLNPGCAPMLTPSGGGFGHQPLHRDRVAGMEPAGDARRANDLEQSGIVANVVRAKTLAHIGVQIDCFGHAASFAEPAASRALLRIIPGKRDDGALPLCRRPRPRRRVRRPRRPGAERRRAAPRLPSSLRTRSSGVVETVPTFRSLMVHYDPLATSRAELEQAIRGLLDREHSPRRQRTLWHVPVCYEGEFAPDLDEVARLTGLTPGRDRRAAQRHPVSRLYARLSARLSLYGRFAGEARACRGAPTRGCGFPPDRSRSPPPDRDLPL